MMRPSPSRRRSIVPAMASSPSNTSSGSAPSISASTHSPPPQGAAVDIQRHAAVAVGVDLHADAAHLAATQHQRRRRTPIAGRVLRLAFLDDSRVDQQRHQQRHRQLGQPGFLGKVGTAHRQGGPQQRVDHHGKIVIAQIVLIDPMKRSHSHSRPVPILPKQREYPRIDIPEPS